MGYSLPVAARRAMPMRRVYYYILRDFYYGIMEKIMKKFRYFSEIVHNDAKQLQFDIS